MRELEKWRRSRILANVSLLDEVLQDLEKNDLFNHMKFKAVRAKIGSQEIWADKVGVSQATIGNYERIIRNERELNATIHYTCRNTSAILMRC